MSDNGGSREIYNNDVSEMWAAHREESRERRAKNRHLSAEILQRNGIKFDSRNDGAHLIVYRGVCTVDFWPGTGKWIERGNGKSGRGVFELLKFLA